MRAAELLVPTFANDVAVAHDHAADHGVGLDLASAVHGEADGAAHELLVDLGRRLLHR